jgi:hypothetical protein
MLDLRLAGDQASRPGTIALETSNREHDMHSAEIENRLEISKTHKNAEAAEQQYTQYAQGAESSNPFNKYIFLVLRPEVLDGALV